MKGKSLPGREATLTQTWGICGGDACNLRTAAQGVRVRVCGGVGRGDVGKGSDLLSFPFTQHFTNCKVLFKVTISSNHHCHPWEAGCRRQLELREIKRWIQTAAEQSKPLQSESLAHVGPLHWGRRK